MTSRRVLIIGAGAAGLAAATRLYEAGCEDFLLLEATDRIGGRIRTVPFGRQQLIDLGAQWCHGERNNVVYEMAGPLGLLEDSVFSHRNVLIFSDGAEMKAELFERFGAVAEHVMGSSEDARTFEGSLGEYFVAKFKGELAKDASLRDVEEYLVDGFISYYHNYLKGYMAVDSWDNCSAASEVDYEECEGSIRLSWKGKGSKTLLELLMKQNQAEILQKVHFNKIVKSINYNTTDSKIRATIVCEDSSKYEADHVIITVSLGVLKANYSSLFTPSLPPFKSNAIEGLSFGVTNKAFLEFEQPFWLDRGNVFRLVWRENDLGWLRFSGHSWAKGVSTFFAVDHCPNILAAWLVGPEGRAAEQCSDGEIQQGLMLLLRRFFAGVTIPDPLSFTRSKWMSDPNFRGSYSSRSLKTEQLQTGAKDLAEPICDCDGQPILLFAGEATSPTHWSTVHGAIESGWREANRLIQLLK